MGQTEIVIGVEQRQLILQAVLALAQRVNPPSHCGYPLANIQVQSLDKGRIDLPGHTSTTPASPVPWCQTPRGVSHPRCVDAGTTSPPGHSTAGAVAPSGVCASLLWLGAARAGSTAHSG